MPYEGFRRNPFSLKLDWVARRLFWVEDGPTVSKARLMYAVDYGLSYIGNDSFCFSRFAVQRRLFLSIWKILHECQ